MKDFTVSIQCPAGCALKIADLASLIRHLQARHEGWIEGMKNGDDPGASTIKISVKVKLAR